jgi:hypothetical protein
MAEIMTTTPERLAVNELEFWAETHATDGTCGQGRAVWEASVETARVFLEVDDGRPPSEQIEDVEHLARLRFAEDHPAQTWIQGAAAAVCYQVHGKVVDNGYLAMRQLHLAQVALLTRGRIQELMKENK